MSAHEWDHFVRWFKRSRLRVLAYVVSAFILTIGVFAVFVHLVQSDGADTYACRGKTVTEAQYRDSEYHDYVDCHIDYGGGTAEWKPSILLPYMGISAALFVFPLLNAGLIGGRDQVRRWNDSERRRLRRENAEVKDRLRKAEQLSDIADRETERIQRQLDSLMET